MLNIYIYTYNIFIWIRTHQVRKKRDREMVFFFPSDEAHIESDRRNEMGEREAPFAFSFGIESCVNVCKWEWVNQSKKAMRESY